MATGTGTTLTNHSCCLVRSSDYSISHHAIRPVPNRSIVNGVKATYYPMPADQFKAVAGEEITEMMGWFSDFGCESKMLVFSPVSRTITFTPTPPIADSSPFSSSSTWLLCLLYRLRWQGDRIVPKGLARGRQGEHLEDVCRGSGLVQGARLIRRHVPLSWNVKSSDLSLRLYTSIDYSSDNSVSVPMFPDRAIRLDDNKDLAGTEKIGHVPQWLRSTWSSATVASSRSVWRHQSICTCY
jgi:hypothetical protein